MSFPLALAWLILSPVWLYAATRLEDNVREYWGYLSLVGVAGLACWAAERQAALVLGLVVLYAGQTWRRSRCYRSVFEFWSQAARESPGKPRVQLELGAAYAVALNGPEAERWSLRALATDDDYYAPYAAGNLVKIYLELGDNVEAASRVIEAAVLRWPTHPIVLNQHAAVQMQRGEWDAAIATLDRGLAAWPTMFPLWENRGRCLIEIAMLSADPDFTAANADLARAIALRNR